MVLTDVVTDRTLVDVATLAAAVTGPDAPTVIDVRWRLVIPGERARSTRPARPGNGDQSPGRIDYDNGHIPGAVFLDLDTDLCGPPGPGGRHPLPGPEQLQAVLRAAGVRAGHPVVVYDDGSGPPAARAWWTLRWAGHQRVAVLDGGYSGWVAAGRPVTTEVPRPEPGDVVVRPGGLPVLDAGDVTGLVAEGGVLLDVRTAPRFRGEEEPIDRVAGHIPGAVNLPSGSLDELRSRFAEVGVAEGVRVGAYCGSGVTAAQAVLALHLAGRPDAALYVGSWSHWINDPGRPVATS